MTTVQTRVLWVALLLIGGCSSGKKSVNQTTDVKVTVYVSNQSPLVDPVEMSVVVDDTTIADQAFVAGMLHSWTAFEVSVPSGQRQFSVRTDSGGAAVDTTLSISETAWVLVSYWNDPTSLNNPTGPKLTVELTDQAPVFK